MTKIVSYLKDENGASAAEYALILAIIGTGIALAMTGLGTAIKNAVTNATTCINTPSTTGC